MEGERATADAGRGAELSGACRHLFPDDGDLGDEVLVSTRARRLVLDRVVVDVVHHRVAEG